jgi:hypothetical protein
MRDNFVTPNGLISWTETHFEVVAHLIRTENQSGSLSNQRHTQQGIGGLYELAEDLATQFEKKFEGKDWDGDFYDEIEAFLSEKENEHFKQLIQKISSEIQWKPY